MAELPWCLGAVGGASGQRVFLREPGFEMLACSWALYSQRHPFFRHVNWDDLLARRVDPPFRPSLVSGGPTGLGVGGGPFPGCPSPSLPGAHSSRRRT